MNEREKLIEEFSNIWVERLVHGMKHGCRIGKSRAETFADWVITDRRRIEKEYEVIKEKAWKYDQLCK